MKTCKLKANSEITSKDILNTIRTLEDFDEEGNDLYTRSLETTEHKITVLVVERYFYRITSTLTVTLIIDQTEEATTIDAISGGGKVSNAFGFWLASFGAEKSALDEVTTALKRLGFEEIPE